MNEQQLYLEQQINPHETSSEAKDIISRAAINAVVIPLILITAPCGGLTNVAVTATAALGGVTSCAVGTVIAVAGCIQVAQNISRNPNF